jgi:hypothetical protein
MMVLTHATVAAATSLILSTADPLTLGASDRWLPDPRPRHLY